MSWYSSVKNAISSFYNPVPYGYERLDDGRIVPIGTVPVIPTPAPEPPIVIPVPEPPVAEPEPEPEVKCLKDYIPEVDPHDIRNHLIQITNASNYPFIFCGQEAYSQMYLQYFRIYKLCMELTNEKYPRSNNKFIMGDAGGRSWQHWAHNSYYGIVDFDYLTSGNNRTHYGYRGGNEKIWVEESYPYRTLLRDENGERIIDLEKMYYFLSLLKKTCPRAVLMVNESLHYVFCVMGEEITQYGADYAKWNHHRHVHCDLGSEIDYDAIL